MAEGKQNETGKDNSRKRKIFTWEYQALGGCHNHAARRSFYCLFKVIEIYTFTLLLFTTLSSFFNLEHDIYWCSIRTEDGVIRVLRNDRNAFFRICVTGVPKANFKTVPPYHGPGVNDSHQYQYIVDWNVDFPESKATERRIPLLLSSLYTWWTVRNIHNW